MFEAGRALTFLDGKATWMTVIELDGDWAIVSNGKQILLRHNCGTVLRRTMREGCLCGKYYLKKDGSYEEKVKPPEMLIKKLILLGVV